MTPMTDSWIDFVTCAPAAGSLDVTWNHGARSKRAAAGPPIQVGDRPYAIAILP